MVLLIERSLRARINVDLAEIRAVLDPNISFRLVGGLPNAYPLPRRRFGVDALIQMAVELRVIFEHIDGVILDMVVEGDRAVILRKSIVQHVGTGRIYEIHSTNWIRVLNGRIVEMIEMTDGVVSTAAEGD